VDAGWPPAPQRHSAATAVTLAVVAGVLALGAVVAAFGVAFRSGSEVGPYVMDAAGTRTDTHWHAALGVYRCDRWIDDGSGPGAWAWPAATPQGSPALADAPRRYAGLHSHGDGVIHMEPASEIDAGENATLGRYFASGGWSVTTDAFSFLGVTARADDRCGDRPAALRWWVNGDERDGDPARYKLFDGDTIVVALVPRDATYPGDPPSTGNLHGG
jgi:hypothetical protein